MKNWHRIISCIFLYLVATGCASVSTPEAADIPTPFPVITVTAKTDPTVTDVPASTGELTPTIPPEKLAEVATIEALITEKPELGDFYSRLCIINGYSCYPSSSIGLSPNKEWAVFYIANESGGLSIVNVNTKKQWNIYYHEIKGYGCDCTVQIEHWSRDGHYLYVSPQMGGDGGMFWFWRDYIQLIRINLDNGSWVDTNMGASYSFSPNDKYIAYRRGQNVVVHDFQMGNEQIFSVPAEYVAFGRFIWSPDSKNIIFVSSSVKELLTDEGKPNGFTLFLLDTNKMKAQIVLEKDDRYLYPLEWQTSGIVLIESLYKVTSNGDLEYNGERGERYKLDLNTNEISNYESP